MEHVHYSTLGFFKSVFKCSFKKKKGSYGLNSKMDMNLFINMLRMPSHFQKSLNDWSLRNWKSGLPLSVVDSRMSNPSETSKCAMESGDENTGKLPKEPLALWRCLACILWLSCICSDLLTWSFQHSFLLHFHKWVKDYQFTVQVLKGRLCSFDWGGAIRTMSLNIYRHQKFWNKKGHGAE